ncbi:MAG: hypothetical protein B7X78_06305 [Sphingomonadales bacterium 39-62-4]|nr:MAG: hypothetical protein B7X78_06305 [Sphingomonadales bacterium 39-62-4]
MHELSRQISTLRAEVDYYKKELAGLRHRTFGLDEIVGESDSIRRLKEDIRKVAPLDVPIFVSGESGSGKELVAHAIHNLSRRMERPMVVVNCGALPANLVESELFGYEAGAFTGARREGRAGKFEMADRTSLFLDEIGDMPMETQVKLLRVIENGVFERVGSNRSRSTNFRLISATNRDLRRLIAEEAFRADLYFRINGVTLRVPPLRERASDIPLLVKHFVQRIGPRIDSKIQRVHPKAVQMLQTLPWPGNVRQLRNVVERTVILAPRDRLARIDSDLLPSEIVATPIGGDSGGSTLMGVPLREARENFEREYLKVQIRRFSGNISKTASFIGMERSALHRKLKLLGMAERRDDDDED